MLRLIRLTLALALLFSSLPAFPALAAEPGNRCEDGLQTTGAFYRLCMPSYWNGDLVVYAHGYVDPNLPVGIPEDQLRLPDGTYLPDLVNLLGYAFATTSYRKNGLAILSGIDDLVDLVSVFKSKHPEPRTVYLAGASEGGIITALAAESRPEVFAGGLSTCGPVGDFRLQINYWGDFRVVFDYFFPGILPPSPVSIPSEAVQDWETVYAPEIKAAIAANPAAAQQLLRAALAPADPGDPTSVEQTVLGLLWYNVHATNDGISTLGGQPFGNWRRLYFGTENDLRLNRQVARFHADPAALAEIGLHYQTSGRLRVPLVTLHTTGDPIVPYWHELIYGGKVAASGSSGMYAHIPVVRYGHCAFEAYEVLAGFALLVFKVTQQMPAGIEAVLADPGARLNYRQILQQQGLP